MLEEDDLQSKIIDVEKRFRESAPPVDQADKVIADALNQLSLDEREKVFYEIHGVADSFEETPEFLNQKLSELDDELTLIKQGRNSIARLPTAAYLLAESMSSEYVQDRKFRLDFLRVDDFNARLAAEKMVRYFDFKFYLFGQELLVKDITLSDFGDEVEFVEKGMFQVLPERDRAGRPVIVAFPALQEYTRFGSAWTNIYARVFWYTLSLVKDEMIQKNGLVTIIYGVGVTDFSEFDPMVPNMLFRGTRSFPLKVVSQHFCFSDSWFRIIVQNLLYVTSVTLNHRAAVKIHQGSQQEVLYSLMTYGIPTSGFPVNYDDVVKSSNHREMLEMQRIKEVQLTRGENKNIIFTIVPDNFDVLFGKGQTYHQRPGNMRLKTLVDEMLPLQTSLTDRAEKIALAQQIVDTVKMEGGRFLSKDNGVWMAVTDDVARLKVSTLFRNRRKAAAQRPAQKQKQQQNRNAGAKSVHRGGFSNADSLGPGDKKRPKFSGM